MRANNIKIKREDLDFKLKLDVPIDCTEYTKDLIIQYIIDKRDDTIFKYNGYHKYVFDLITEPFYINGTKMIMTANYGGNHDDIYRYSPEGTTLADGVDYATIKFID